MLLVSMLLYSMLLFSKLLNRPQNAFLQSMKEKVCLISFYRREKLGIWWRITLTWNLMEKRKFHWGMPRFGEIIESQFFPNFWLPHPCVYIYCHNPRSNFSRWVVRAKKNGKKLEKKIWCKKILFVVLQTK